jgi:catechol 2,3-dioxygenase-like lactoylglutathione lyase family enzyme
VLGRTGQHYWGAVLEAPDAHELAGFYARLLGWQIVKDEGHWVTMHPGEGFGYLAFNTSPEYERPVWPPAPGRQQMMLHLDVVVDDLERAVEAAVAEGATVAEFQPQDDVRVMLDPAGHPFCLYVDPAPAWPGAPARRGGTSAG